MFTTTSGRLSAAAVSLIALSAPLAVAGPAAAEAEQFYFFEETAEAFWSVPHTCADGSTVQATLLVRSTRDFEAPDTDDPDPTARVQYNAPCQDGSQVSWGRRNVVPATITSTENLKSVTATGEGLVRDDFDSTLLHPVSFDVTWTAVGPLETEVNPNVAEGFSVNVSSRKQREATATGRVVADGVELVNGVANPPPGRPAPFIRVDEERTTRMP
jgi:hypothetical protein